MCQDVALTRCCPDAWKVRSQRSVPWLDGPGVSHEESNAFIYESYTMGPGLQDSEVFLRWKYGSASPPLLLQWDCLGTWPYKGTMTGSFVMPFLPWKRASQSSSLLDFSGSGELSAGVFQDASVRGERAVEARGAERRRTDFSMSFCWYVLINGISTD